MTGPGSTPHDAVSGALPDHVGVVGGGRMGSGIAHAFLVRGVPVTLIEADADRTQAAAAAVAHAVHGSVDRGLLDEPAAATLDRLTVVTHTGALAGCDLVIEAVPENESLKREVLAAIAAAVEAHAVIASNTSSLSISSLARRLPAPERLVGMHFFNPVPASALVEVVTGDATDRSTTDAAQRWARAIGKTPVTVADSPGFATSRLGVLLGLEAIRMLEAGVAAAAEIDAAMTLGYRHPVGPLELTDLVGLDVRLDISDHLASTLGDRFAPPQLLKDMVGRGELGRKTGIGFYRWTTDGKEAR